MHPHRFVAVAVLLGFAMVTACSDSSSSDEQAGSGKVNSDAVAVRSAFYPLEWMAERVGGDLVEVSSLTPPGAEPHDLELSANDVAAVTDADVVVFLSGFQPAVDEAVAEAGNEVFDAAEFADLSLEYTPIEEGAEATDEAGSVDPHFWLDPVRLADVADAFAATLAEVDPDNAGEFQTNADALREDLEELDEEFAAGLANCADTNLVTSHNAFGYLADRYGFDQVGITGLTPEEEPSPSDLAAVTDFVEANDVDTIYFETLVSPDIAEAIASETGASTEVLDPLEGLNDESQGADYLEVMRSNLANLQTGQSCT